MAKKPRTMNNVFEVSRITLDEIRQLPESEIQELLSGSATIISNFMPANQMHILYNEKAHRITLLANHEMIPAGRTSMEQIDRILQQRNTGTIDYTGMDSASAPKDAIEFVLPEYLSTHYPEFEMAANVVVGLCLKFALGQNEAVDRIVQQEIQQGARMDTGSPILNRVLFFLDVFEMLSGALLMLEAERNGLLTPEAVNNLLQMINNPSQTPPTPQPRKTAKKTNKNLEPPIVFTNRTVGRA